MFKQKSLRYQLHVLTFAVCILPLLLGNLVLQFIIQNTVFQQNVELENTYVSQIIEYIDYRSYARMEHLLQTIASNKVVLSADRTLRKYSDLSPSDTKNPYSPGSRAISQPSSNEQKIIYYFKDLKELFPSIHSIFLGVEDEAYVEYPTHSNLEGFNPKKRPWYQAAVDFNELYVSEPIQSQISEKTLIFFSKKVILQDGRTAVVGLSIDLDLFTETFLSNDKDKHLLLTTHNGIPIKSTSDYLFAKLEGLGETSGIKVEIYDRSYLYVFQTSGLSHWKLHSLVPIENISGITHMAFLIIGIILVIIILSLSIAINLFITRFRKKNGDLIFKLKSSAEEEFNPFEFHRDSQNEIHILENHLFEARDHVIQSEKRITNLKEFTLTQCERIELLEKQNFELRFYDPLTKLPNKSMFKEELISSIVAGSIGAVIILDIDNFKLINDTQGHAFGDKVLTATTERLSSLISDNVSIARFGADEFLVLLQNEQNERRIKSFVSILKHSLDEPVWINGSRLDLSFSMGISVFPKDSTSPDELITFADVALHKAKSLSKKSFRFFDASMTKDIIKTAEIEDHLKECIERDGFKIVLQPQVSLKTGRIKAFEALVRLRSGRYSPFEFISIVEDNGDIVKIGRLVIEETLKVLANWKEKGLPVVPISINFSVKQLVDTSFHEFLYKKMHEYAIPSDYIEIEITENAFIENKEYAREFLLKIKQMGIKISIDDFGTGYSSFSYLTFIPLDKIKLDRSVNLRFLELKEIQVMDSLINLAHALKLEVVAEGIEDYEHFKRLQKGGCDSIQGYIFSPPVEVEEAEKIISTQYFVPESEQTAPHGADKE